MKQVFLASFVIFSVAWPAGAQTERPAPAIEVGGGWAGFVDNKTVDHGALAGALRVYITPRLGVGPEIVFMNGPGSDQNVMVTGNITFDVRRRGARPPAVQPYLVAGGGFFRHTESIGSVRFSSSEGSFTAGGGVRVNVNARIYVAADARIGWEPHLRLSGIVGYRFGR